MVVSSTNTEFQIFLPGCIDYAEQRMYRELDLLVTRVTDSSASLTANTRNFTLPTGTGTFLVVESVNVISSAGTPASSGTRNPLTMTARELIDISYPANSSASVGQPEFYAMVSNASMIVGPTPDGAYVMEVIGTQFPSPLSSGNSSTFLTQQLPDAFMAASMVFASGYQRDFGGQSDNPAQSASWEAEYGKLIQSANVLELRKKHESQAWTSQTPNPIATPPRT